MKIVLLGRGTVGCLVMLRLMYDYGTMHELIWAYDPDIEPASVGEGSTINVTDYCGTYGKMTFEDFAEINAMPKLGIFKQNWGQQHDHFLHPFLLGGHGMHFNAVEFQKFIFERIKNDPCITHKVGNFAPEDFDADFVISCTGKPKIGDEHELLNHVPVNSCFVSQCPWEVPQTQWTLCIARPHGWVFGIPLENRISIGYLYNSNISTQAQVEQDVQNIFDEWKLEPATQRNIDFQNYKRIQNYTQRQMYTGVASFFTEPLEATSIGASLNAYEIGMNIVNNHWSIDKGQDELDTLINEIECIIALHYMAGSKFKSDFWEYAQELGTKKIENEINNKTKFSYMIKDIFRSTNIHDNLRRIESLKDAAEMWPYFSYKQQIHRLGIISKINSMLL